METPLVCLVCSTPILSIHLGMDICRACASFFKRAIKAGIQYPCRQSTRRCPVSRETKMCRRCRFDKCIAVGINFNGPMRVRKKPEVSLLQHISKEFKSMIDRRRTREMEFLKTCQHKCIVEHPREIIYAVDANSRTEINVIDSDESLRFFENTFPSLQNISNSEKENLFKDYANKLSLIVNYYLTQKVWGGLYKKFMTSAIICYDPEITFDFYYPEDDGSKDFFKDAMISFSNEHVAMFTPLFKRSQLTETEFYALSALVLTESDLCITEEAHHIMDEIRLEIFKNLQLYYQNELGLIDFSTRLGNLMSLNHTIQECQALYNVVMKYCSTFFDTYMTEKLIKSMTLDD